MTPSEQDPLLPSSADVNNGQQVASLNKVDSRTENYVEPEAAVVGRRIGWTSAYIIVISRVVGSGIFAVPGTIIQTMGSPGAALVLWVLGTLTAWAGLAIDLEYGCMFPKSGGMKVYLEYTYRWPKFLASTMVAIQIVLLGQSATNCIVFAKYILFAFDAEATDTVVKLLAVALLTTVTVVHGCLYRTGIWIQNVIGWLKIALVAFMVVTGFLVIVGQRSNIHSAATTAPAWWQHLWADSDWAWNNVSTSFFKIFYSYAGLNNINNVLNEVKNPVRTLKTVAPAAIITACILYLLVNLSYLTVIPLDEIRKSRELIAALFFECVFGQHLGRVLLPLAIATSAVGNVMVVTFSHARLNQEVARQGFLPLADFLASSKPFGAPLGGLIVHSIPTFLVITCLPSGSAYSFIMDVEGYAHQPYSIAVAAGLLLLRYRKPELKRLYRAWPPAACLQIMLGLSLLVAPFFPSSKGNFDVDIFYALYAVVAWAIIFFGIAYWFIWIIAIPSFKHFKYEEEQSVLDDGTVVTRLARKTI